MTQDLLPVLLRIAEALERLAPPARPETDLDQARLFHFSPGSGIFQPVADYPLDADLLLGIERQKQRLSLNLQRFAKGLPANHSLLWGGRGAGKSSVLKSVFMALSRDHPTLRLVEIDRDETGALPDLFERLRQRPQRFIVFCDDLSFEEGAAEAKALKSALEGGLAGPPANVLFVATSNRRHLMPRDHGKPKSVLDTAEDTEEEVSVSDRFGLSISFPPMDQPTYLQVVHSYAAKFELIAPDLDRRALQWAQLRGARSGRVAWQFIRDLAGELGKPLPL
jgi:predicted AAA+ superfamily ATPase